MNLWQTEQIRLSILRYLGEAAPYAMAEPLLQQCLHCEGWTGLDGCLPRELEYLHSKGLIEEAPKFISPENRAWRITAAGRDLMGASVRSSEAPGAGKSPDAPAMTGSTEGPRP